MRYHVLYLVAGDRETTHVEAPDAATAVEIVDAMQRQRAATFELLSVVPIAEPRLDAGAAIGAD